MSQMIHYQDDLFYISVLVKSLEAGLSSEADPDFFRERIVSDICFLDGCARNFMGLLAQNSLLIERAEYLKLLERTARGLTRVLEGLLAESYPRASEYAAYKPRFETLLREERILLGELGSLVSSSVEGEAETELVSQDELSELLRE